MKQNLFSKFILVLSLILTTYSFSQNDEWQNSYKLLSYDKTLEICKSYLPNDSTDCSKSCYNFVGIFDLKFKVPFIYEGSISEVAGNKSLYIDRWAKTYWPAGQYNELFKHLILVSNKKEKISVFVQEPTLEYYPMELKKGDKVYLYLMFVGTLVTNNVTELIFVANDFEKR